MFPKGILEIENSKHGSAWAFLLVPGYATGKVRLLDDKTNKSTLLEEELSIVPRANKALLSVRSF